MYYVQCDLYCYKTITTTITSTTMNIITDCSGTVIKWFAGIYCVDFPILSFWRS